METELKIMQFFYKNNNTSAKAEALSKSLSLTANDVLEALKSLKSCGYIDETTENGCAEYKMSNHDETISAQKISSFTLPAVSEKNIIVFDNICSTNETAKRLALSGADDKTIVIAQSQSAGKGRKGRSFYSPERSGIYMSIIKLPQSSPSGSVLITSCSAVAVCRAIEKVCSVSAQIKWVNDIICRGKKVCGILTEALTNSSGNSLQYIVTGIGVNCFHSEMPAELAKKAGSVSDVKSFSRNMLCAQIINEFISLSEEIESRKFINEYRQRSAVIGQNIEVFEENQAYKAKALDIDNDCCLIVKATDGSIKTLNSGEISIGGDFYE